MRQSRAVARVPVDRVMLNPIGLGHMMLVALTHVGQDNLTSRRKMEVAEVKLNRVRKLESCISTFTP